MRKKLFIHGGSSPISKYLIRNFLQDFDEFYIFCRNELKTREILKNDIFENKEKKFFFFENDLNNLNDTIRHLDKLPNDISGIIWVSGSTGNVKNQINNYKIAHQNLNINLVNIVLCLSLLMKKILIQKSTFIAVITSVAGLRGRAKVLYYSTAKGGLINFLSGLRQFYNEKIKVVTIIPGYISSESSKQKKLSFLNATPQKVAKQIYIGIKQNKEIIYVNKIWRLIMFFLNCIPEKIFKKFNF